MTTPISTFSDSVTSIFHDFCQRAGLTVIVDDADRYGSIEWLAGKIDNLQRILSLSFTELSRVVERNAIAMEIWATVSNDTGYLHEQLHRETVRSDDHRAIERVLSDLHDSLRSSWSKASEIQADQLTKPNVLVVPQPPPIIES